MNAIAAQERTFLAKPGNYQVTIVSLFTWIDPRWRKPWSYPLVLVLAVDGIPGEHLLMPTGSPRTIRIGDRYRIQLRERWTRNGRTFLQDRWAPKAAA